MTIIFLFLIIRDIMGYISELLSKYDFRPAYKKGGQHLKIVREFDTFESFGNSAKISVIDINCPSFGQISLF